MPISKDPILRQLSRREAASRRWASGDSSSGDGNGGGYAAETARRKRVMVVVEETSQSKHAMTWALTHVAKTGDIMTLLHVVSLFHPEASLSSSSSSSSSLVHSLGSLCKACKPEVEVEALVVQGPKLATVVSQVKKLKVSVLVLGQKKSLPLISCLCGPIRSEAFVDECINGADCLTIGVRKQSRGVGGYVVNTRWQKNFWLLA